MVEHAKKKQDKTTRNAVAEGSINFDFLGFFDADLSLSTRASSVFTYIENAAATARISSLPFWVSSRVLKPLDPRDG